MKNKLDLEFATKLLHDALTARVKNTNRAFYWLVRNSKNEWKLFREEPEYNSNTGVFKSNTGTAVFVLREASRLANNVIPVKINLDDYRPCKLGTMKIALGQEIPTVRGGGNVFNFIEEVNDMIYNWYIDNDIDRPDTDSTHEFDVEAKMEGGPALAREAAEEATLPEDTGSASEVIEAEEDPFGPLYERSPIDRVKQWADASKLKDLSQGAGVTLHETMSTEPPKTREPFFSAERLEEAVRKDPIKHSIPHERQLQAFIKQSCIDLLGDEEFDEEIPMLTNIITMLPRKYQHIRRLENGAWVVGVLGVFPPVTIYHNPSSKLCPVGVPTQAYKFHEHLFRVDYSKRIRDESLA